jgi:hypothetical protein
MKQLCPPYSGTWLYWLELRWFLLALPVALAVAAVQACNRGTCLSSLVSNHFLNTFSNTHCYSNITLTVLILLSSAIVALMHLLISQNLELGDC